MYAFAHKTARHLEHEEHMSSVRDKSGAMMARYHNKIKPLDLTIPQASATRVHSLLLFYFILFFYGCHRHHLKFRVQANA